MVGWLRPIFGPLLQVPTDAYNAWYAFSPFLQVLTATPGSIPKVITVETMAERERKRNHSGMAFVTVSFYDTEHPVN
jgi:hypothetical protein